jgi:hypothetical protein
MATGLQQEATAAMAVTTAATAASAVPPEPVPIAVDQAAVVEIPDDNAQPPGWGQWENWPTPAPEPAAGVLVMWEDSCVMPWQPTHGTEASSSCARLPTSDVTVVRPRQDRRPTSTRPKLRRRCGRSFETTTPLSTTR